MKVHFYLDRRKGKKDRLPVFLHFWYKGKLLRIFTGEHCDLKNWDSEKERVKYKRKNAAGINQLLQSMEEELLSVVREARAVRRPVTVEYIRDNLSFLKDAEREFFSVWDEFIEKESESRKWGKGTINRFNTLKKHLYQLNASRRVYFKNIDNTFYKKFIEYHRQQGFKNSYAARNLELFRWFMNWASEQGYNLNMTYKTFKTPQGELQKFEDKALYLTPDELMRLYKMQIKNPVLVSVKDIFCFGCFTGLRYSDIMRLTQDNINKNKVTYTIEKPYRNIEMPLIKVTKEILDKYLRHANERIFPDIPIQSFNKYLKILGKLAGIDTPVTYRDPRNNQPVERTCKKWEIMSTMFARRTFLNLGVKHGIPLEVLCELTGNLPGTIRHFYKTWGDYRTREMQKLNIL